jgi:hypothetical protein
MRALDSLDASEDVALQRPDAKVALGHGVVRHQEIDDDADW